MPANPRSGQYNANRLLRELWLHRGLSRIQLSQRLDLDKSTVTHMISRMEKQGIVTTLSEGCSSARGGRKPLALGINGEYAHFLGLEIQPGEVVQTLIDLEGHIIKNDTLTVDLRGSRFKDEIGTILKNLHDTYSRDYPLMAMGLGFSGIVNPHEGRIMKSMLLHIREGCLIDELIPQPLPCPLIIENDANCCTWGEILNEKEGESLLFLLLESDFFHDESRESGRVSLGMGISLNGRVYRGRQFSAGEFISPQWSGDRRSQFSLSYEDLIHIGKDREIRLKLFKEISRNAAFLINSLDLDRICVGGDIGRYWEELEPILINATGSNRSYPGQDGCRCTLSQRGKYAVSYGAAVMPLMQVFSTDQDDTVEHILQGREGLENFGNRIARGDA